MNSVKTFRRSNFLVLGLKKKIVLRLNEVKLPLDHSEEELHVAAAERLSVNLEDIHRCEVFRRAVDARKRSAIQLTYTLDVEVKDEQEVLTGNENSSKAEELPSASTRLIASSLMPTVNRVNDR